MYKLEIEIPYCNDLSDNQKNLIQAVVKAHTNSAKANQNASSFAFLNATGASGRIENGIVSAILTLGDLHGPIEAAREVYREWDQKKIYSTIAAGKRIAGFGNSFFKIGIDPSWQEVSDLIQANFHHIDQRISNLSGWIQQTGKKLYPNAALFSAACCEECGFKNGTGSTLFILSRIPAWVNMVSK